MYDFALENLARAYHIDPKLYEAAALLGDLYNRKKEKLRALSLYNASLALNDRQDAVHVRAGELEDFYARYDLALAHFLKACDINPDNYLAHLGAARPDSAGGHACHRERGSGRAPGRRLPCRGLSRGGRGALRGQGRRSQSREGNLNG